jgi:CRISPR-associated protein Cmr2
VASHLEEGQCNNSPLDGSCVYAGGDDVLAFLPVARALDGAAEVSRLFAEHLPQGDDKYSVSGGLVIAHTQTSFEELREAADRAEKLAKEERRKRVLLEGEEAVPGYLTIVVSKRSGNEATFVMPWKEAVDRLRDLARAFSMTRGGLSSKTPYDLREQLEGVPWCTPGTIPSWSGSVPEAEIRRILNRKRGGGETVDPAVASTVLKLFEDVAGDVGRWERGTWRRAVDALLIARSIAAEAQIGETTRAAGGKPR